MSAIIAPLTPSTGGTPAGSTTQVQFNDAGVFGADAGLIYDKTTDALTVSGSVTSVLFRSAASGNIPFVARPSGTGAFQLQVADNTATGGNARGANACDLQTSRSNAANVASGASSFACGSSNTGSGEFSAVFCASNTTIGGYSMAGGQFNTATGNFSAAFNYAGTASGVASISLGSAGLTKGVESLLALGSIPFTYKLGASQTTILGVGGETTSATPRVLTSNVSAASATNQLVLLNNSAIAFFGLAVATITGGGDTAAWKVEGCIKRGANAASTALVGTPTVTSIGANAGASGWTLALTANTTNGCLTATATNGAGVTVRVNLSLFSCEVAF